MSYNLPQELIVEGDGAVRTVLINRPAELNAVSKPLHWALANVWQQLAADRAAKVVILTGAGRAFCAGGDVKGMSSGSLMSGDADAKKSRFDRGPIAAAKAAGSEPSTKRVVMPSFGNVCSKRL